MSVEPEEQTGPLQAILLPIREEDVPRVLEAIKTLDAGAEVTGFAVGRPIMGGPISGTKCSVTGVTSDYKCGDSDRQ